MRKKHEVRHENKPQRWVKVCLKGWRANRKHILLQSLRRRIPTENLKKKQRRIRGARLRIKDCKNDGSRSLALKFPVVFSVVFDDISCIGTRSGS
jgi:hypothetical protein